MGKTPEREQSETRGSGSAVSSRSSAPLAIDEVLDLHKSDLLKIHTLLSDTDFKRHRKKFNQDLSNAITFLASSISNLENYLKERVKNEKYGKEEG